MWDKHRKWWLNNCRRNVDETSTKCLHKLTWHFQFWGVCNVQMGARVFETNHRCLFMPWHVDMGWPLLNGNVNGIEVQWSWSLVAWTFRHNAFFSSFSYSKDLEHNEKGGMVAKIHTCIVPIFLVRDRSIQKHFDRYFFRIMGQGRTNKSMGDRLYRIQ
jgi:hypothetical protein